MKVETFLLLVIFCFTSNCKKEESVRFEDESKQVLKPHNEILENENNAGELLDNSRMDYRNSIEMINNNKRPFKSNLNFGISDIFALSKLNIAEAENFLENHNWTFISKDKNSISEQTSKVPDFQKQALEELKEGTKLKYRNEDQDSECILHIKSNGQKSLSLLTTNKFNYNELIQELNELNFRSREGDLLEIPGFGVVDKKYIGELMIIENNIRTYKKNSLKINVITFVKSPVVKIIESKESLVGYDFAYNPDVKLNSYLITVDNY